VRVDELRILEAEELGMRLRTSRRELYELRFKHAVGQLDNASQIRKVRHDIARIMTVLHEREYGIGPTIEEAQQQQAAAVAVAEPEAKAEAEPVEQEEEQAPKPKRGRGRKKENAE
jgi:large subunit ribosomal protein L29